MSSANHVNFALRPNKAVERKLIFELLLRASELFPFNNARYVGFGSLWFVDFLLAHKLLGISELISIEGDPAIANRCNYNKPFGCVRVLHGESSVVLPDIDVGEKPAIIWLDYDTSIDGPALADLDLIVSRAPHGSFVFTTLNAHRGSLPKADEHGREYSGYDGALKAAVGDLAPARLGKADVQVKNYPKTLANILFTHMDRALRKSGREGLSLLRIADVEYQDGSPMVTVGVAVVEEAHLAATAERIRGHPFMEEDRASHLKIAVPPLTLKEKVALDQLLPSADPPTEEQVAELGFEMKLEQISAYFRFYKHYPAFGEIQF